MSVSVEQAGFKGSEENQIAGSIYRCIEGRGMQKPTVLFMHGGGQTRYSWHGAASQMASKGNICVTIDARGHGDSEWVDSKNYRIIDYRDDLRHLCRQVRSLPDASNVPPILVGASMGGISAMLAQQQDGVNDPEQLFSAIVLVDITPRMEPSGVDKILTFMSKNMRGGFSSVEEAANTIAAYLPDRKRPKSLDGLRKNLRKKQDGRWYWHWDPAFVDGENNITTGRINSIDVLFDAVRKIDVPTLLVRGAKSELVTQEAADEFLELVPHAKYVDVSDAGHMVAGDKNDIFTSAVIEFLENEGLVS